MGEIGTTDHPVELTRKCLGPRRLRGVRIKPNRCFGSRLGGALRATLTGFNFEGEKPLMAFKGPNDSVMLASPPHTPTLAVRQAFFGGGSTVDP